MDKIRWGIIGAGNISTKFAKALCVLEDVELAAIASRDAQRAKNFAEQFQIKKVYTSYEELAKDPEIDVIYIGTPHTEHKANSALCIMNNKAVLCEKPFTVNHKDTEYLISLAREKNVFLMEAMWTKFLPVTYTVKQWLKDEIIGNVRYLNISFGYQAEFNMSSRLYDPNLAGGALLDVGVYPITYTIDLMGRLPDSIASSAYLGKSGVDEVNVIAMRYDNGVMADLSSAVCAHTSNEAVIVGEKGKIVIPNFWSAEHAEAYNENGEVFASFHSPFAANGYEYEAAEVNRCLREGKKESDRLPLTDTLEIMKVMDSLRAEWGLVYPQER